MREAINSDKGKAGGEKAKQHQKRLAVSMRPVIVPDAEERRRRAIDLLLQVAARSSQSEKNQNGLAQHQCKRNP